MAEKLSKIAIMEEMKFGGILTKNYVSRLNVTKSGLMAKSAELLPTG
ncbi:MAG: hypothetical protein KTR35_19495 [Gammaproteobacteria bacterium]|nr:hypothetical protein [Gammaproteobacteria bacterium]